MAYAIIRVDSVVRQRLINSGASLLFVATAFLVYRFSPHTAGLLDFRDERMHLSGSDLLTYGCLAYSLLLLAFYFTEESPRESKSIAALRALRRLALSPRNVRRSGLPYNERLGLLTILLKGFFAPLMVLSLFQFSTNMVTNGIYIFENSTSVGTSFLEIFNSHGFWFLLQLILFFDVGFFTIGYLIEHPLLKNEIRSVDPTWLGWTVALACYPPLNGLVAHVMGWSGEEFPQFADPLAHVTVNSLLLVLMAIYAWASVALNLKASNLTHRGIISHGPYRFVRHPAYVCKNAAWWLGVIPTAMATWQVSAWDTLVVIASAAAWSAIYALRALTEEDHLRTVDGEYDEYCRKVRYRFIPGVY